MDPPPPPDHHFASGGLGFDDSPDGILEEPTHYEERRPNVQQRFSTMSLHDDLSEDRPTRTERGRSPPDAHDFVYYRVRKDGEDWGSATSSRIPAPVAEIKKRVRKGKGGDGPILEQMTRMAQLRRDQIEGLVQKANRRETGDDSWDVVYIKSKRIDKPNGKFEVPEMGVILERTRGRARNRRQKSYSEDVVNVRDNKEERVNSKRYSDDTYKRARKDSVLELLEDPVANRRVFEHDGRPMNDLGPINFDQTGLPSYIPPEKPLGAKNEFKKEERKRDKSEKRSKSRNKGQHHGDGILVLDDEADFHGAGDALPVDALLDEGGGRLGRRRGKSPRPRDYPHVVEEGRRSHSRTRMGREKSRSRKEPVHFPNEQTRGYFHESSASSENSDLSHFGIDDVESSNTSFTSGGPPRRGSLARRPSRPESDRAYKQHHRGPTRSASYVERPYHGEDRVMVPARTRSPAYRYRERPAAEVRYECRRPVVVRHMTAPIPLEQPVVYHEYHDSHEVVPVRRATQRPMTRYVVRETVPLPMASYPEEEHDVYDQLDRRSSRIEDYQNGRIMADWLRERDPEEREWPAYYDDRSRAPRQIYGDERIGRYVIYDD